MILTTNQHRYLQFRWMAAKKGNCFKKNRSVQHSCHVCTVLAPKTDLLLKRDVKEVVKNYWHTGHPAKSWQLWKERTNQVPSLLKPLLYDRDTNLTKTSGMLVCGLISLGYFFKWMGHHTLPHLLVLLEVLTAENMHHRSTVSAIVLEILILLSHNHGCVTPFLSNTVIPVGIH